MNLKQYERLLTVCRRDCFQETHRGEVASRMIPRVKERIAALRGIPLNPKVVKVKSRRINEPHLGCFYQIVLCLENKCEAVVQSMSVDEFIRNGRSTLMAVREEYLGAPYTGGMQ